MQSVRAALVAAAAAFLVFTGCGPSSPNDGSCGALEACGDVCVDTMGADNNHCGGCGIQCAADEACSAGVCRPLQPECSPGESEPCYFGPPGTAGVGACRAGERTCLDNGRWSGCNGQVTPVRETGGLCANGVDDDCDGTIDNGRDEDGDGYTTCQGDCCDSPDDGCQSPELVNPGAFEAPDNMLDDDCDGNIDNVAAVVCDEGLVSNSSDAFHHARAIGLCQTATEAPGDTRWGVISARFVKPDGNAMGATQLGLQKAIRPNFGATMVQQGHAMLVLSTANAAAPGQTNPSFSTFSSTNHGQTSGFPSDWYQANGNALPNAPGCPAPSGNARDPVMYELRIRTPTNARSFSLSTNFMSAEYPEWTCSPYNDFFVVLLDSSWTGQPQNPADKNLAVYTNAQNQRYPVGVNLAHGNTGLFTVCKNGPTGCAPGAVSGNINTCVGIGELANTGMDVAGYACGSNDLMGGGTGWLTTSGNVNGGEVIRLRIALWDTSDNLLDSVALIDNFQWSVEASEPGTVIDVE